MAIAASPVPAPPDGATRLAGLPLFASLPQAALEGLAAEVEWLDVPGGTVLFREGDPADGLFVVVTGRLKAVAGGDRVLAEMGRGEPVGELGLLVDEPRSATVRAMRDSLLLRLTTAAFERLVHEAPRAMLPLAQIVARRLVDSQAGRRATSPITAVAVITLLDPAAKAELFDGLLARMQISSRADVLTPGRAHEDDVAAAVEAEDQAAGVLLLDVGAEPSPWASRCLRQADRVLLVASADGPPSLGPAAGLLRELDESGCDPTEELVLLHPPHRARPSGTARWLALRPFAAHHHVRRGDGGDTARLARHLTGRSVGLVLGGGAAKCFAHVGVHRALREADVPIDLAGGTSGGAILAAQIAAGWSPQEMEEVNRREWRAARMNYRYTIPFLSLLSVRKAVPMFERMFGDADLEDLWLPCFATTVDLSACRLLAQRRGPATTWIRASASPPGIWPPVADEDGRLYVDGGVLDNLPVQFMRGGQVGRIVTVNVSPYHEMAYANAAAVPSSAADWLRAVSKSGGMATMPNIVRILHRTAVVTSLGVQSMARTHSDLYIQPDLAAYGFADYPAMDRIAAAGLDEARRAIAAVEPAPTAWAS